jgi:drug/metabolite transporter (DMT)-like permease
MMTPFPKMLIIAGIVLIVIGVIWMVGGRFFNIGRLPGDIVYEKGNVRFYFPIVTCIVASIVLSLIFYIIRLFSR